MKTEELLRAIARGLSRRSNSLHDHFSDSDASRAVMSALDETALELESVAAAVEAGEDLTEYANR